MPDDAAFTLPPETDAEVARAEKRIAALGRLTELRMDLAEDLTRRALAAPDIPDANAPAPRLDPAGAFAKVSAPSARPSL